MWNIAKILICLTLAMHSSYSQYTNIGQEMTIRLWQQNNLNQQILIKAPNLLNANHLSLQVQSTDYNQYNEINIAITINGTNESRKCRGVKYLVCVLQQSQIQAQQQIRYEIKSNTEGIFKVMVKNVIYDDIKQGIMMLNFTHNFVRYFRVNLQQFVQPAQDIRLVLIPKSPEAYCHISCQTSPTSTESYSSVSLWKGAEGLFLSKKQFSHAKFLYYWVIGEYNSQYIMSHEVLIKTHHDLDIPQQFYQFIDKNQLKVYHLNCQNITDSQELVLNFQIFSGNPQIILYYQQGNQLKPLKSKYFHYMADAKFILNKNQLKGNYNLYMHARSNDHSSVFYMQISIVKDSEPQLMIQNSYNFQSLSKNKYLYCYIPQSSFKQSNQVINISLSILHILGRPKYTVFLGNSQSLQCLPHCQSVKFKQIKDIKTSVLALKQFMSIPIDTKDISPTSILLLKLQHTSTNFTEELSVEYKVEGRIVELRENYPLTQVAEMGQSKYYKYTPLQSSKGVKICVSTIAGNIGVLGSYKNPLSQGHTSMTSQQNCLNFDAGQIKKTVYVSIYGISKSKYSVSVQVGHHKQIIISPTIQTNQDIDYQVIISGLSDYMFVMHPIYNYMRIFYNASKPVTICMLDNEDNCIGEFTRKTQVAGHFYYDTNYFNSDNTNNTITVNNTTTNNINIYNDKSSKIHKLMVKNTLMDKISFKLKYHSGNYDHCQQRLLNKIYQQDIISNSCYQFQLPYFNNSNNNNSNNNNYEILIKKDHYSNISTTIIGICGKQAYRLAKQQRIKINSSHIAKYCSKQATIQLIIKLWQKPQQSFKTQYILQKQSSHIYLPYDIQYRDKTQFTNMNTPLRQYISSTQLSTNIILSVSNIIVPIKIYIYLVQRTTSQIDDYNKLQPFGKYVLDGDNQISIAVLAVDVRRYCERAQIKQCLILTTILPYLSNNNNNINIYNSIQQIKYSIQLKSSTRILKQNQPQSAILSLQQSDIYTFYPNIDQPYSDKYKAIIQLSTHNVQCAYIYINKYQQPQKFSTLNINSNDNDNGKLQSYNGQHTNNNNNNIHQIVIDSSAYLIQIAAHKDNCRYTLQLFMIKTNNNTNNKQIQVLHPQIYYDINIGQAKVKYMLVDIQMVNTNNKIKSNSNSNSKILFMRKYGNVHIYAVQMTNTIMNKIVNNLSYVFDQNDFSIKETFQNVLHLPYHKNNNSDNNNNSINNSENSWYIIAIKGQVQSQGTILQHGSNFPLLIPHTKKIVQYLQPQQQTVIKYYTPNSNIKSGKININLFNGNIKIKSNFILNSNLQTRQPLKITNCCTTGIINIIAYKLQSNQRCQYVQIKIMNPSVQNYSIFQISLQLDDNLIDIQNIDSDSLQHVEIIKEQITVLKSLLATKEQEIVISLPDSNLTAHHQFYNKYINKQNNNNKQNNIRDNNSNNNNNNSINQTQLQQQQPIVQQSLLSCIVVKIGQQNKDIIKLTNKQIIMGNILLIGIEWPHFILKNTMQLLIQLSISEQCRQDSLTVSVTTNMKNRLGILMPFRWAYIKQQRQFAIATMQQFYIDLISCSGNVELSQTNLFANIHNQDKIMKVNDFIKNQPHVLAITPTSAVTYIKLRAKQATIRVIIPDFNKQTGMGYLKYEWDYFLYDTDFQKLMLYINPIKTISQTKTQIVSVSYLIKIVEGLDPIHASVQCQELGKKTIYSKIYKNQDGKQLLLPIAKEEILQLLKGKPQNLYLTVDLSLRLKTPNGEIQSYKFIAPTQKIPVQIFNITKLSNKIVGFGIISIVIVIFCCVLMAEGFIKYIVPILGRLKGSNQLVEQEHVVTQTKQHQIIPVSSDRNERGNTEVVESQQKMKN